MESGKKANVAGPTKGALSAAQTRLSLHSVRARRIGYLSCQLLFYLGSFACGKARKWVWSSRVAAS
ncbi:hypothetical protein ACEQUB_01672 [Ralstonia syzygii]